MPSGRYNKKKKEKKKIEEEQNNENVESRKTSKSSRHFYNQTLDAAQRKRGCEDHSKIDSSIITTKRLTVGVKGIFGNARNSNSVYREFQKKLDKRKLSKEVSSEIEQNLSKIFPNRKKCNCTNRSSTSTESHNEETRYQTPSVNGNNNSTPHSQLRSFKTRSHQGNQSVESASSTKCSTHSTRRRRNNSSTTSSEVSTNSTSCNELTHSTTPIVQDEFSRIARDIVNAIPSLKIFKEKNLLDNLRKELQEIHQTKYELKIIPKFDTEFSQNTNEDLVPASKKHCSFEEMEEVDPNIPPETEKVMIITANQYEEKPPSIKRITEQETHFTAHHAHIHQQQLDFNQQILPSVFPEPMEVTSQETNSRPQFFFTNEQLNSHEPINANFFVQRQTTSSLEEERRNYTDKWTASTLLQQPISSLRCNRRRSSRQTFEETDSNRSQTDLLDFIDNIPIDDLERKLLNRGSVHEQRAVALSPPGRLPATVSRHHIASLERPKVSSPSPPKMYRMNMF